MSDPNLTTQRQIQALSDQLERLRKSDVPSVFLPYAQRALNAVAATATLGDFAQPWEAYFLVYSVSVFVATTNNGTNFWTIDLVDTTGATIASVTTSSGVTAATWTRLSDTTVTQPLSTNVALSCIATKTLTPGNLFAVPSVSVLRIGN
jgi:hypothetical protein